MKQYGSIAAFSRREFLVRSAVLPVLTCFSHRSAIAEEDQSASPHQAPYLALAKYINPGEDEFAWRKGSSANSQSSSCGSEVRRTALPIRNFADAGVYRAVAPDLKEAVFSSAPGNVAAGWKSWVESLGAIERVEFYVLTEGAVRYEVKSRVAQGWSYRVGFWNQRWSGDRLAEFTPISEQIAFAGSPWFRDVTAAALQHAPEAREQLLHGIPYWRAKLDPASGIDIYGSNGIAVGDIDGDGADEVYVCQPGGLPNRLFKFQPDGTLADLTDAWGVGILDDTSCALFLDLRNSGRQDLVVLRSSRTRLVPA